jgi:hypothetical protein
LFVITAEAADVAVVFRRGPADWFHLLAWDLASDELTPGAWFRGRLYPEKCDLSSDGRFLLNFAHQGNKSGSSYTHAWTAVSRPPWLSALALWPAGTTYGGGGRFVGRRSLMLRHCGAPKTHPKHPATGLITECGNPPLRRSLDLVEDAEWSGKDHRGNVLFAREGVLYRRFSSGHADRTVADLAGMVPIAQAAPEWARAPIVKG